MKNYPKNRNSESRRLANDEFLKKFYSIRDKNEFTVIDPYITSQKPIRFIHNSCKTVFYASPNNMLKTTYGGCPVCGRIKRRNTKRNNSLNNLDSIEREIKTIYPNFEYIFIKEKSTYINNKEPTLILKCNKCENEFKISLVNLRQKRGCPICNKIKQQESKNVKKIKNFLNSQNIEYLVEYKIDSCKNKRTLPFDFAFNINGTLKLLEYDGEFHDRGYNNDKASLENVKRNDAIKTNYCLSHNIPLLRLKYNDFKNFEDRIKKFLFA